MCSFLSTAVRLRGPNTNYIRQKWVYSGISHRSSEFISRRSDGGFMVDKMELEEDFVGALRFSPVSIIPPMFHTQSIHLFIHSSIILSSIPHRAPTLCNLVWSFRHSPNLCFAIQTHKVLNTNEVLQPNTTVRLSSSAAYFGSKIRHRALLYSLGITLQICKVMLILVCSKVMPDDCSE